MPVSYMLPVFTESDFPKLALLKMTGTGLAELNDGIYLELSGSGSPDDLAAKVVKQNGGGYALSN